jgi:CBS domain-containing protein
MFVEELLSKAREELVTVTEAAPLIQAAKLLQAGADLVIVCDSAGHLVGVISNREVARFV